MADQLDLTPIEVTQEIAGRTMVFRTGHIARQASGTCEVSYGDTVVLATVVGSKRSNKLDFFPLTVNYVEKFYAAGRIPGGYFKREGRPTKRETLSSRIIDRTIRPLFADGFMQEVQVVAMVMSFGDEVEADIAAMAATSAAVSLSGLPMNGPVAASVVGMIDGELVLNPTEKQLESSEMHLLVAGTKDNVVMVESEAQELPEDVMLDAIYYGHESLKPIISSINELVEKASNSGSASVDWSSFVGGLPSDLDKKVAANIKDSCHVDLENAYTIPNKNERKEVLSKIRDDFKANYANTDEVDLDGLFYLYEKDLVRSMTINGKRMDGRSLDEVRDINIVLNRLPKCHGDVLFTRGQTQAAVILTLGSTRDGLRNDTLSGDRTDRFMLHYNFPAYCVGECGMMLGPKRREIGHGRLAERAVSAILPSAEDSPYTFRIVAEITESNGSSSMASVCGSSLALMDAGIDIKGHVAGVAMGLVSNGDNYAVLTDITGDEDHLGDMDFKVAGTANGITALQMDIKIDGLSKNIMQEALAQALAGRLHIIGEMNKSIDKPREEMSSSAPRAIKFKIATDRIRDVIGRGGSVIKEIIEKYDVSVDISDDGVVQIHALDGENGDLAHAHIKGLVADIEVGEIYTSKIKKIMDFGAFVSLIPNRDGFLHISEISSERVENINDHLTEGQEIRVKVVEIDKLGRVRVSIKKLDEES